MTFPLLVPFHDSGRVKSYSNMYFRMCAAALVRYQLLASELSHLNKLSDEHSNILKLVEPASVEPVVFAGMCLESTLYDLGASLFGESYAKYTDKLDPVGKFVAIARITDGKTPEPGSITFQSLQALISARNNLVHHKSHSAVETDWQAIFVHARKKHKQHVEGIASCFKALVLLSLHFDGNIFEELRILPSFKKPEYWQAHVPVELYADVEWCIQASKKEKKNAEPK